MNIVIFGPPGAGKGTQSEKIARDFNLVQISTGDLLRNEIQLQTMLGKKIESLKKTSKNIYYSLRSIGLDSAPCSKKMSQGVFSTKT